MDVVVRRITAADAQLMKETRLALLLDTPSAFGSTYAREIAFPDAEWEERAANSAHGSARALFFAEIERDVVGIIGGFRAGPGDATVELVSMWTAPNARRHGVGRALVTAVVDWATATEAESIELWVTIGNGPAESFYLSLGFEPTGEQQPIGPDRDDDEARMVLRLS